jgi:hypothetical protein
VLTEAGLLMRRIRKTDIVEKGHVFVPVTIVTVR